MVTTTVKSTHIDKAIYLTSVISQCGYIHTHCRARVHHVPHPYGLNLLPNQFTLVTYTHHPLADPGFGSGGPQNFVLRFCLHSKAKSGEQSEPILAGAQGPL